MWIFILVLVHLLIPVYTVIEDGTCIQDLIEDPIFSLSPGGYNPQTVTIEICQTQCHQFNYPLAGLQYGHFCMCSANLDSASSLVKSPQPSIDCNFNCTGGFCGGLHGFTSVYHSSNSTNDGNIDFDVQVVDQPGIQTKKVIFQAKSDGKLSKSLRIKFSDDLPATTIQANPFSTFIAASAIYEVTAMDRVSKSFVVSYNETFIQKVSCPLVAELSKNFQCNVSVFSDYPAIQVQSDNANQQNYDAPGSVWSTYGHSVSRTFQYSDTEKINSGVTTGDVIFISEPVTNAIRVNFVEYFAIKSGAIKFKLLKKETSGTSYIPKQTVVLKGSHTDNTFNVETVSNIWAEPGDFFGFECDIGCTGYVDLNSSKEIMVNNKTTSSVRYMLSIISTDIAYVQVEQKCTEALKSTTITFTDNSDIKWKNTTNCQISIRNLHIIDINGKTDNDGLINANTDLVDIRVSVEEGGPVSFIVNWGDSSKIDIVDFNEIFDKSKIKMFSHKYNVRDTYKVNITARNLLAHVEIRILKIHAGSSLKECPSPNVYIRDNSTDFLHPMVFNRSNLISLYASANINCSTMFESKKYWTIHQIDDKSAKKIKDMDARALLGARVNRSEMVLFPNKLEYGLYEFNYTFIIYDPTSTVSKFSYNTTITTYMRIISSEIVIASMRRGIAYYIKQGKGQTTTLDPKIWSKDVDFPEYNYSFKFKWFCRRLTPTEEDYKMNQDGSYSMENMQDIVKSVSERPIQDGGGCFGFGQGPLNYSSGKLVVSADMFYKYNGTIYEVLCEVTNHSRIGYSKIYIEVMDYKPVSVEIRCAADDSCIPANGFSYINSRSRLALVSGCLEECETEYTYRWSINVPRKGLKYESLADSDAFITGIDSKECSISETLFLKYPDIEEYFVTVYMKSVKTRMKRAIVQGNIKEGMSGTYFRVNKKPIKGNCTVSSTTGKALVEMFELKCFGWVDPEGVGIMDYSFYVKMSDTQKRYDLTVTKWFPATAVFPVGDMDLYCEITDAWGAITVAKVAKLKMTMPTKEEYDTFIASNKLEKLRGGGDVIQLTMYIQSQASVQKLASWFQLRGMNISEADSLLVELALNVEFAAKILNEESNIVSLSQMNVISSTMSSCLGPTTQPDLGALTLGLKARDHLNTVLKDIAKNVDTVTASPQDLALLATNTGDAVGNLLQSSTSILYDKEDCQYVPPIDTHRADSMLYDVDIGDDLNMEIPSDPATQRRCNVYDTLKYDSSRQVPTMMDAMNSISENMLSKLIVDESLETKADSGVNVKIQIANNSTDAGTDNSADSGSSVKFPTNFCLGDCRNPMSVSTMEMPTITHNYVKTTNSLSKDTSVVTVNVFSRDMEAQKVIGLEKPITIVIPRKSQDKLPDPNVVNTTSELRGLRIPIIYTMFQIAKPDSAANIEITPMTNDIKYLFLMISYERMPTLNKSDDFIFVNNIQKKRGDTYDYFMTPKKIANRTGRFFVGVAQFKDTTNINTMQINTMKASDVLRKDLTTDYTMRIFTSGCYYFKEKWKMWTSDGVKVISSDYNSTICQTTHLSQFGSGFFPMPNTVDFAYVFAHAGFSDNLTIYMCIIVTASLYILLLIWAKRTDIKDKEKYGCLALPDNKYEDKYLYEINVTTGSQRDACTESQVYFILSGESEETETRTFGVPNSKFFQCGSNDSFVMCVSRPLGDLNYIRVYHNNSGKGRYGSWFLSCITFTDLQTGKRYEFISNRWFAVEHDDGLIDRMIPAAGLEQKNDFSYLFKNTSQKNMRDGHLWLSVFTRPPRSRFTRVQRVSVCMAVLYLSMLTNAMWYEKSKGKPAQSWDVGPLSLNPEQFSIGLFSNLIVFPPSFLMVFLFKKSRARKVSPNRINEALNKSKNKRKNSASSEDESRVTHHNMYSSHHRTSKKKKPFVLPWFCRYIGWLLVFMSIAVSIFFLWAYGIQFGNEKTTKWLTALIISFFSSVLLVQPVKVFLVACLVSLIFKRSGDDDSDITEDEEELKLQSNEEWLSVEGYYGAIKEKSNFAALYEDEKMKEIKEQRLKEVKMWEIVKEMISYGIFLWIVLMLSYGSHQPSAYQMKETLQNHFIYNHNFDKVKTANDYWQWAFDTVLQELRIQTWYNGEQPYGMKGFLNDRVNRIMGYAVLRQIRVKPNSCGVPKSMKSVTEECAAFTHYIKEDKRNYCEYWERITNKTASNASCNKEEFRHMSAKKLSGMPLSGKLDTYGGGGYVLKLIGRQAVVEASMKQMQQAHWIDKHTRAVILEFSVYNAQVNLFGISTIMVEVLPGGGMQPSWRFDVCQLLRDCSGFGSFLLICEIIFIIFIIYYTIREMFSMYKMRSKYFSEYSSYMELVIIVLAYSAIVIYVMKTIEINSVVSKFAKTHGNGYVKLQWSNILDSVFGYLVSFMVFLATLKFIKLLRFNKRMGILSHTLRKCWDDLTGFFIIFLVFYLGFVGVFFFLLNKYVPDYNSFLTSIETGFTTLLGNFDFDSIQRASPLAAVIFMVYNVLMSMIMINLLLTIVITSFQNVKADINNQPDDYQIVKFMTDRFKGFIGKGQVSSAVHPATILGVPDKSEQKHDKVEELPDKIHKFLEHVNNVYFEGVLDVSEPQMMKKHNHAQRSISGDDAIAIFTPPVLRRPNFLRSRLNTPTTPRMHY